MRDLVALDVPRAYKPLVSIIVVSLLSEVPTEIGI